MSYLSRGLNTLCVLLIIVLINSCKTPNNSKSNTVNTLSERLKTLKGQGVLFGHQDDLAYGMGWEYVDGESDVKRISGSYPAVVGWDLGGIEKGDDKNLDNVPFEKMRQLIQWSEKQGIITTISWHPYTVVDESNSWTKDSTIVPRMIPGGDLQSKFDVQLDIVADFFLSLKDAKGNLIPIIFRPWHEMDGSWFFWGGDNCKPEDYKELYKYTVNFLKKKGLSNLLFSYSPDRGFDTKEGYLTHYPGDAYVDILGMDNYYDLKTDTMIDVAINKLKMMVEIGKEKNKLTTFSETGLEFVSNPKWFTQVLGKVLDDPILKSELSYVLVWRNDDKVHHYFSYPNHASEQDAKAFLKRENIWLLEDVNGFEGKK